MRGAAGLKPYTDWIRQIYTSGFDWTAQIVEGASLEDLDQDAIRKAREGYIQRNPDKADDCKAWDDATFLDRAKLTKGGRKFEKYSFFPNLSGRFCVIAM